MGEGGLIWFGPDSAEVSRDQTKLPNQIKLFGKSRRLTSTRQRWSTQRYISCIMWIQIIMEAPENELSEFGKYGYSS